MARQDALDLLKHVDGVLVELFRQLDQASGPGVVNQAQRGTAGKQLVRYVSVREAAKDDIARVIDASSDLGPIKTRLVGQMEDRRSALDSLDRMVRHVRPIDINRAQDAEGTILRLRSIVEPEIAWELGEGIEAIETGLTPEARGELHGSRYLRRHAPSQLDPHGTRWYERAPVVGWLLTKWDRLQDRPRPMRASRIE